ncbi:MAG: hypothetical protein AABO58_17140 [Acidobacteriota bacterium]
MPSDNNCDVHAKLNIDQPRVNRRTSASSATAGVVVDVPVFAVISRTARAGASSSAADTAHEYRGHTGRRNPLTVFGGIDGILEHIKAARRSGSFFVSRGLAADGVGSVRRRLHKGKISLPSGRIGSLVRIRILNGYGSTSEEERYRKKKDDSKTPHNASLSGRIAL